MIDLDKLEFTESKTVYGTRIITGIRIEASLNMDDLPSPTAQAKMKGEIKKELRFKLIRHIYGDIYFKINKVMYDAANETHTMNEAVLIEKLHKKILELFPK